MKISISSDGEDEALVVTYVLRVENDDFKGTIEFYGYADAFQEFSNALLRFPFESRDAVNFEADGIALSISLLDPAGRINFKTSLKDDESNFIEFNDSTLEIEMLHKFAALLSSTEFSNKILLEWDSDNRV